MVYHSPALIYSCASWCRRCSRCALRPRASLIRCRPPTSPSWTPYGSWSPRSRTRYSTCACFRSGRLHCVNPRSNCMLLLRHDAPSCIRACATWTRLSSSHGTWLAQSGPASASTPSRLSQRWRPAAWSRRVRRSSTAHGHGYATRRGLSDGS